MKLKFYKYTEMSNFMEIRPVRAEFFRADGPTEGQTERQTDDQTWRS
jgi:hypothetical protein